MTASGEFRPHYRRQSTAVFFCLLLECVYLILFAVWPARAASAPKLRIVIIHATQSALPATTIVDEAIRREMQLTLPDQLELYSEFLDTDRFPKPDQLDRLETFLRSKYASLPIDLVILAGPQALDFVVSRHDSLFPGSRLLFAGLREEGIIPARVPPQISGVISRFDPVPTVDLALRLQPGATRMVVINGVADIERGWEATARRKFGIFASRLEIAYWSGMPLDDVLRKVASLPQGTFIVYFSMLRDGAGQSLVPRDVAQKLSAAASVPVYGTYDSYIGQGIVGGNMATLARLGRETGGLALKVLLEHRTGLRTLTPSANVVDWRQLQRWGLKETDLPPGTDLRYRVPSLWEEHKWLLLGAVVTLIAQSLLISALIVQGLRRRRTETSLRESEERISLAATSVHLGFWRWDSATDQIWASDVCRQMLGLDAETRLNLAQFLARTHPGDREITLQSFRHASSTGEPLRRTWRSILPDGSTGWMSANALARTDPLGQTVLMTGVVLDVTPEKQAQIQSEIRQQELTHLGRIATLGELSGAIAHELNQPLTAILSNAQAARLFLAGSPIDLDEIREILGDIAAEGKRAGEVIRRLRTLFKKANTEFEPVNLNEIATEVMQLAHGKLVGGNVNVAAQFANRLPIVRGDQVQLQQVLLNIVVNACDAMDGNAPGERDLTIATSYHAEGSVRVAVSDCGAGIDSEIWERLFEPFVTTKATGIGLGLSICRSIVQAHGGRLWAANNPDRGATFWIALPVDKGSAS